MKEKFFNAYVRVLLIITTVKMILIAAVLVILLPLPAYSDSQEDMALKLGTVALSIMLVLVVSSTFTSNMRNGRLSSISTRNKELFIEFLKKKSIITILNTNFWLYFKIGWWLQEDWEKWQKNHGYYKKYGYMTLRKDVKSFRVRYLIRAKNAIGEGHWRLAIDYIWVIVRGERNLFLKTLYSK